jgi:hypothetical protein
MAEGLSNKVSNVMGVRLPLQVRAQLQIRAAKNSSVTGDAVEGVYDYSRSTDNIKYLENKTGWARLVSSVDVVGEDLEYFKRIVPANVKLTDGSSLAKYYVLSAGTSIYQSSDSGFKYGFRSSLTDGNEESALGAYGNIASMDEIKSQGYRPMPGITEAKIQTQGRLGSVRQATISFKVWTKDQLDIIDALYFKMGYLMFLEWGHAYYYSNKDAKLKQMGVTVDPFAPGITKEELNRKISEKKEEYDGNYDAMLGMCTQFNFDFNQDGGYDCTIKMIGLGALADSAKINISSKIPDFKKELIEQFYSLLRKYKEEELRKQQQEEAAANKAPIVTVVNGQTVEGTKAQTIDEVFTSNNGTGNILDYTVPTSNNTSAQIAAKTNGVVLANSVNVQAAMYRDLGVIIPLGKEEESLSKEDTKFDGSKFYYFAKNVEEAIATINSFEALTPKAIIGPVAIFIYTGSKVRLTYNFKLGESAGNFGEIIAESLAKSNNGSTYHYYMSIPLKSPFISKQGDSVYLTPIKSMDSSGGIDTWYGVRNDDSRVAYDRLSSIIAQGPKGATLHSDLRDWANCLLRTSIMPLKNGTNFSNGIPKLNIFLQTTSDPNEQRGPIGGVSYLKTKQGLSSTIGCNISSKQTHTAWREGLISQNLNATTTETELLCTIDTTDFSFLSATKPKPGSLITQDYLDKEAAAEKKKQEEEAAKAAEEIKIQAEQAVKEEGLKYSSGLETFLRSIQLYSLNYAVTSGNSNANPNFDFREVSIPNLATSSVIDQLFSNGLFTENIKNFLENSEKDYDDTSEFIKKGLKKDANKIDRLLSFAAYGFNHNLMHAADPEAFVKSKKLQVCDFKGMFQSWVIPYDINTEVLKGIDINHPVYIRLDLLLMAINHMCLLYDSPKSQTSNSTSGPSKDNGPTSKNQTPLLYVDFNTHTNLCLSTSLQLSVDIMKFLIQFRATNSEYRSLFNQDFLNESKLAQEAQQLAQSGKSASEIGDLLGEKALECITIQKDLATKIESEDDGEDPPTPLFKPESEDKISAYLPEFKDPTNLSTGAWSGRIMKVLVNVDYLLQLCANQSNSDDSHGVYLKPFLQQLITDLGKSLGDINVFRLAYSDPSNCLFIVDDQSSPLGYGEQYVRSYGGSKGQQMYGDVDIDKNSSVLPLYGRKSIAKSLNIKTEVSTKLSNMLAISANSDKKSDAGKDASPFGQYNMNYINRYVNQTRIIDAGSDTIHKGEIKAARAFNDYMNSIFKTDQPKLDNIDQAVNYYVERMNDKKAERNATRASAMIPVSVNFTTDGISGLAMGHAFEIPKQLLPRAYERFEDASGKKVGFVVIGLDHSISNNNWETSVKANMFFMKDRYDYYTSTKFFNTNALAQGQVEGMDNVGYVKEDVPPNSNPPYVPGTGGSGGSASAMTAAMSAVFKSGGASGLCAYYTYSIANSYVKALRGESNLPGLVHAGGNANDSSYRQRLQQLGYKMQSLGSMTKSQLITEINRPRAIGDIINYASLKPVSSVRDHNYAYIYGHTQIYHGENAYNLSMQGGKHGKAGWASSWSNNYGASFVYGSKNSDLWECYLFTLS